MYSTLYEYGATAVVLPDYVRVRVLWSGSMYSGRSGRARLGTSLRRIRSLAYLLRVSGLSECPVAYCEPPHRCNLKMRATSCGSDTIINPRSPARTERTAPWLAVRMQKPPTYFYTFPTPLTTSPTFDTLTLSSSLLPSLDGCCGNVNSSRGSLTLPACIASRSADFQLMWLSPKSRTNTQSSGGALGRRMG